MIYPPSGWTSFLGGSGNPYICCRCFSSLVCLVSPRFGLVHVLHSISKKVADESPERMDMVGLSGPSIQQTSSICFSWTPCQSFLNLWLREKQIKKTHGKFAYLLLLGKHIAMIPTHAFFMPLRLDSGMLHRIKYYGRKRGKIASEDGITHKTGKTNYVSSKASWWKEIYRTCTLK